MIMSSYPEKVAAQIASPLSYQLNLARGSVRPLILRYRTNASKSETSPRLSDIFVMGEGRFLTAIVTTFPLVRARICHAGVDGS